MRRDTEQRLGELPYLRYEEILDVLRSQYEGGLLFTDALHTVSDILDSGHIGKEKV